MSELTRKQFNLLVEATNGRLASQRSLAAKFECSVGTINKVSSELSDRGYIADGIIIPAGLFALEPYRAKRAVFLAAGFGSRLVPVTLNTPKPLVRVNGKRIIDGLIDAVLAAGIEEICIVRENVPAREVDITSDIREELLLTMPSRFLCSEECKGLCPGCGANLNDGKCTCGKKKKGILKK